MNNKKGITVNMLVRNEDCWVYFALQAVLPFVDKALVYDTGSIDKTVEIIKSINSPKIVFEQKGPVDRKGLVELRKEQIQKTQTEWILLLDGDEIWPKQQLEMLIGASQSVDKKIAGLVNRTRNALGDVYHFLPESAGRYQMAGQQGNLNLRMLRNTQDLSIQGEYPLESFINSAGPIEKQTQALKFVDCWLLHTSFLTRSSLDQTKTSGSLGKKKLWEKGTNIKKEDLPEVLFNPFPKSIKDPLQKRSKSYEALAMLTTPILEVKRKLNK